MRTSLVAAAVTALGVACVAHRTRDRRRLAKKLVAAELHSPFVWVKPRLNDRLVKLARRIPLSGLFPLPSGVQKSVRTVAVPGRDPVGIHLYEPAGRSRPSGVLCWIHGGGYVFGSAEMGQSFGGRVAAELGVLVVSVDYRLAPEHPFPAPLEDCYTGLRWVHAHASELGVDPTRIAVGGDSAGGGLAAAMVQLAHDRAEVPVCFQLLVYPMLDDRTVFRADDGRTGQVSWNAETNLYGWSAYLGRAPSPDTAPTYAAPARREDLRGLPPAWIGVGDIDLFHGEDLEYAQRLAADGVEVQTHVAPGMFHGADALGSGAAVVREFDDSKIAALRRAFTSMPDRPAR